MPVSTIKQLRILPPLATDRFGSSPEAWEWPQAGSPAAEGPIKRF
jgi:hypothetical protein